MDRTGKLFSRANATISELRQLTRFGGSSGELLPEHKGPVSILCRWLSNHPGTMFNPETVFHFLPVVRRLLQLLLVLEYILCELLHFRFLACHRISLAASATSVSCIAPATSCTNGGQRVITNPNQDTKRIYLLGDQKHYEFVRSTFWN